MIFAAGVRFWFPVILRCCISNLRYLASESDEGDNAGEMSSGFSTDSYPAFAHIELRENLGKNLNQWNYILLAGSLSINNKIVKPDPNVFFLRKNFNVIIVAYYDKPLVYFLIILDDHQIFKKDSSVVSLFSVVSLNKSKSDSFLARSREIRRIYKFLALNSIEIDKLLKKCYRLRINYLSNIKEDTRCSTYQEVKRFAMNRDSYGELLRILIMKMTMDMNRNMKEKIMLRMMTMMATEMTETELT
ncbi:hypothetical protein ANN_18729 [Periplaneta americana]|uniref:Uncharacterized protein n=1 Tax=Periplaneta americana TaxID=6978 RepID=A0ABQ8SR42_PERAM|nr:hypothetical protein ANN_18729 [Periplaneta americana]